MNKDGTGAGSYEGATQDNQDIWKHIQTKYTQGWYIPSRGEWAAFADYLKTKKTNPLTHNCSTSSCSDNGNYDDIYGLSGYYCSSSENYAYGVWGANFNAGCIDYIDVDNTFYIRLGATF